MIHNWAPDNADHAEPTKGFLRSARVFLQYLERSDDASPVEANNRRSMVAAGAADSVATDDVFKQSFAPDEYFAHTDVGTFPHISTRPPRAK